MPTNILNFYKEKRVNNLSKFYVVAQADL